MKVKKSIDVKCFNKYMCTKKATKIKHINIHRSVRWRQMCVVNRDPSALFSEITEMAELLRLLCRNSISYSHLWRY